MICPKCQTDQPDNIPICQKCNFAIHVYFQQVDQQGFNQNNMGQSQQPAQQGQPINQQAQPNLFAQQGLPQNNMGQPQKEQNNQSKIDLILGLVGSNINYYKKSYNFSCYSLY